MEIILIDDDFFITTALKTILEADENIHVTATGSSGTEAVSLLSLIHISEPTRRP